MDLDHEKLDVYRASLEIVALANAILAGFPPGHADLADQLKRASTSIALNIAEGAGEFARPEKIRFYRFAKRSAMECAAVLDIARRIEILPVERYLPAREHLVRVVSMLVGMMKATQAQPPR